MKAKVISLTLLLCLGAVLADSSECASDDAVHASSVLQISQKKVDENDDDEREDEDIDEGEAAELPQKCNEFVGACGLKITKGTACRGFKKQFVKCCTEKAGHPRGLCRLLGKEMTNKLKLAEKAEQAITNDFCEELSNLKAAHEAWKRAQPQKEDQTGAAALVQPLDAAVQTKAEDGSRGTAAQGIHAHMSRLCRKHGFIWGR